LTGEATLGAGTAEAIDEGDPLQCYRHPDRETYVRCGRCDRPICPRCAMSGLVGLRCRECGSPGRDPLTKLTPTQVGAGLAVALGGGTVAGFAGLQMGFFLSLCAGPFIGALIGEGVMRATGYKRGNIVRALVVAGIVGGVLIAAVFQSTYLWGVIGYDPEIGAQALGTYLWIVLGTSLFYVGAALIGAFARLR
jgi:hypothetical protein